MFSLDQLDYIHIEASTYCNARCSQCPRNFLGYNIDFFEKKHLDLSVMQDLKQKVKPETNIFFCGNYGDSMMHPNIVELCKVFKNTTVNTNGGIGKLSDYVKLAKQGTTILFSIDGLEDTNHIYRQDVVWSKLMERVNTFIQAGGDAVWKFIPFKHNEHQVKQAEEYAYHLGFRAFEIVDTGRNTGPILDNNMNIVGWLGEPEDIDLDFELKNFLTEYDLEHPDYSNCKIDCKAKQEKSFYIDVDGNVLPCCYLGVRNKTVYGQGKTLQEQLNSFQWIEEKWNTTDCLTKCAEVCGKWQ